MCGYFFRIMTAPLCQSLTSMETPGEKSADDCDRPQQWFPNHTIAHLCVFIVMVLASVLGIVANIGVIITFRLCKKLRSTTNLLVEVLSYLDLIMAVVGLPITAISALKGRFIGDHLGVLVIGFAMTYLGLSNINVLTAIAFERFVCVVHPHRKIQLSPSVTKMGIIVCLSLPLIWSIAPLCGWNHYALEGSFISSSVNWVVTQPSDISYTTLLFVANFFIPVIIISYSYWAIFQQVGDDTPDSKVHGANMGPIWGPSGADRTQVGPMLAPWAFLSGYVMHIHYRQKYGISGKHIGNTCI